MDRAGTRVAMLPSRTRSEYPTLEAGVKKNWTNEDDVTRRFRSVRPFTIRIIRQKLGSNMKEKQGACTYSRNPGG